VNFLRDRSAVCTATLVIMLSSAFVCGRANADVISLAQSSVEAGQHSGTILTGGPGTSASVNFAQSGGVASARVSGAPDPTVSASASGVAFADASLTYYFKVGGPTNASPITIGATLAAAISYGSLHDPNVAGVAGIRIDDPSNGKVLLWDVQPVVIDGSINNFVISKNFSLQDVYVGKEYRVTLSADAESNAPDETASAFVDPNIYIDPMCADPNQYQIIVSEGIGNSPVPEPTGISILGTMALFLVVQRQRAGRRGGARESTPSAKTAWVRRRPQ
jgi:hypothetical protein